VSVSKVVAVVDDEQDIITLFHDALKSMAGITVITFSDPLLALEHFQMNQNSYVLVISDFKMPGLNGLELLKKMKDLNKFVRTILMTAFEIDDQIFGNYTKGKIINGFIQKPVRIYELIKEVNTQIHSYEMQKCSPSE